jgi:hypothetical protein
MKNAKKLIVYLTEDLDAWLEARSKEGYKKASIVRHVLEEHIKASA